MTFINSRRSLLLLFIPFAIAWDGSSSSAPQVKLDAALGTPLMLANKQQTAILRVALTGFELERSAKRSSVNMAIVLDRSSSMAGDKMEKAKEAALMIVDRLSSQDILSVVTYDSGVNVLVPAAPLYDRDMVRARIRAIQPTGSTALFAGVSKGIEEVRKYVESDRVNRVILLSDGQANIGPSSPNELGRLGAASARERIAITTFGLGNGYNEDLMSQLALKSDGNHAFVETPEQLAKFFDLELGDVLAVVAQEIAVKIKLADGVRAIRVLNREAEIRGQNVVFTLGRLVSKQERFALIELELAPGANASSRSVASVDVSYQNMQSSGIDRLSTLATVAFTNNVDQVYSTTNNTVMVAAIEAIAADNNRLALQMRDEGKVKEAKALLYKNAETIRVENRRYNSEKLDKSAQMNFEDSEAVDTENWGAQRKKMRKNHHTVETQSMY